MRGSGPHDKRQKEMHRDRFQRANRAPLSTDIGDPGSWRCEGGMHGLQKNEGIHGDGVGCFTGWAGAKGWVGWERIGSP